VGRLVRGPGFIQSGSRLQKGGRDGIVVRPARRRRVAGATAVTEAAGPSRHFLLARSIDVVQPGAC